MTSKRFAWRQFELLLQGLFSAYSNLKSKCINNAHFLSTYVCKAVC